MRVNSEYTGRVVPAEFLETLADPKQVATLDSKREALIDRLSTAPLVSARVVMGFTRAMEGLLLAVTGTLIAVYHPGFIEEGNTASYLPLIAAVGLAFPLLAQVFGLYTIPSFVRPVDHIARLFTSWTLIFAAITMAVFLSKSGDSYSRVWLASWYAMGLAVLVISRMVSARFVHYWNRNGQLSRHAVLVGGGQPAEQLLEALDGSQATDVAVVGIFDDRDDLRSPPQVHNLPKLGTVSELIDFVRRARIDILLVTLPLTAEDRLLQILKRLWVLPVDIRLSAYTQKLHYRPRAYSYIGNVPFLDVFDKPLTDWGLVLKAIEDRVIAALALILLSPVMLLVALAIKFGSKGPVLFKQKRYGFNNELIEVYKFRSMYHNMSDADAAKLVTKGDPRVTPIGRFLRKSSLDELPQIFNVLRGELSLVGPRPHATKAKAADQLYNDVVDGYFARHRVKPGITGWAQINGWRGETDTAEKLQRRVEHDLYYIENWSLAFDLYILWCTPISLLKTESAY
ncbi:MAG: undecaprenyl-phosphate glucose phosphotransferase [Alphaproteobacteria bacterium]|nr:undecaprenyl-phosphate glucose phosphotransferase [Alphaproteobacteria bacterium]